MMKKIYIVLLIITICSACQSVKGPLFTRETFNKDTESVIYIYRNPGIRGLVLNPLVNVDGKEVSPLRLGNYIFLNLAPGKHTISVTDNINDGAAWEDSENIYLNLDLKPGTEEFYRFEVLKASVDIVQIGSVGVATGGSRTSGLLKIENEQALQELTSKKFYKAIN